MEELKQTETLQFVDNFSKLSAKISEHQVTAKDFCPQMQLNMKSMIDKLSELVKRELPTSYTIQPPFISVENFLKLREHTPHTESSNM
jgi:hypothetical protein